MMEWEISDQDIESTEKLLLPEGAHFQEDARMLYVVGIQLTWRLARAVERPPSFLQS